MQCNQQRTERTHRNGTLGKIQRLSWIWVTIGLIATLGAPLSSLGGEGVHEPPEGFKALFNGKDLSGWEGLVGNPKSRAKMSDQELARAKEKANERARKHWHVKDGVLQFDGKGKSLVTAKDYADFELYVDWKITEGGDSGIYLRGTPQVQIWDPSKHNGVGSGGLYNNQKHPSQPLVTADKAIGKWNTFRIKMRGHHVWVWLNDEMVVPGVVMENYWDRDRPIYRTGQIELQSHGSKLAFRNIFIRELVTAEEATEEGDWTSLTDSEQWRPNSGWEFEGDTIRLGDDGGGYLWTKEKYEDFVLDLEFNMSENCNSGIFFRTNPENAVHGGFEIQILDSHGKEQVGKHDCGALYDVVAPRLNATRDAGEWNHLRLKCDGPIISGWMNGRKIFRIDISRWTEPGKNPDGSSNKFRNALAELARNNHIGLQDHGHPVSYRNVRIKRLD